jgi:CheY-like chemotaxis protein
MPDVDGVEVIMTVRRRWPQVRIVALSGGFGAMDAPKLLHMAKMLGADAAVSKPFTGSQLLASVAQALSYRRD